MKQKRYLGICCLLLLLFAGFFFQKGRIRVTEINSPSAQVGELFQAARGFFSGEPEEVRALREQEVAKTDEGHQEYYFQFLTEEEDRKSVV